MYSQLGVNIKKLRTSLGETQSDLLFAIGSKKGSSPSTISQYETGKRVPQRETIAKIAKHYRVTEEELLSGDFSSLEKISLNYLNDKKKVKDVLDDFFPLVESEHAQKNSDFREAYKLHIELYNQLIEKFYLDDVKYDKCVKLYRRAIEVGNLEACANIVWWNMLIAFIFTYTTPIMYENPTRFRGEKLTVKEAVRNGILPLFDIQTDEIENELQEIRKEFIEETEIETIVHIYKLKHSKEYSELGDYYLALRHKFGLVTTSLSDETNILIGNQMLFEFALMQNPYAKRCLKVKW